MEHRHAHRVPAEITITLRTADGVDYEGCIKDISALGAGIVLSRGVLTRGTLVKIQVCTNSLKPHLRNIQPVGYIVRHNDQEFGLLWVNEDELTPIFGEGEKQYA